MRIIGKIPDVDKGRAFSAFLHHEGIENECEILRDEATRQDYTQIWIYEEDQLDMALQLYAQFLAHPDDPKFNQKPAPVAPPKVIPQQSVPLRPQASPIQRNPKGKITILLALLCVAIFIWQEMSAPALPKSQDDLFLPSMTLLSKAQILLSYDYPKTYELAAKIYRLYPLGQIENPASAPPELSTLLNTLQRTPYWKGAYEQFFIGYKNPAIGYAYHGPMFEKISEGEIWRLFTPMLMHADIFHIFFNLAWLMLLGHQIEKRLGTFKYIFLILAAAAVSNTAEYLMSGPNFLGLSGVICAMAGFIWGRQKKAPWEGYYIHPSTMLFITLFVFAMAGLQVISFISQLAHGPAISPGIANTAHLTGGFFGLFLGRSSLLAWKSHR